jgi:hypothetical protein
LKNLDEQSLSVFLICLEELFLIGNFFFDKVEGLLDDQTILFLWIVLFDPFGNQIGQNSIHELSLADKLLHLPAV